MYRGAVALIAMSIALGVAGDARAVVKGSPSSLGGFTVRIIGGGHCSGVLIGRQLVATAAHCGRRGARVHGSGGASQVAGRTRSAQLDDGRRVRVSGDAVILRLASPLSTGAAPIGPGYGNRYTIAGYGTVDERHRGAFGALHEATLVAHSRRALVDPNRRGSIGASACFGDSGGPVLRGGALVGVITRAAHPSRRIACGYLTRWASVTVSGATSRRTSIGAAAKRGVAKRAKSVSGAQVSAPPAAGLFGLLFGRPQSHD